MGRTGCILIVMLVYGLGVVLTAPVLPRDTDDSRTADDPDVVVGATSRVVSAYEYLEDDSADESTIDIGSSSEVDDFAQAVNKRSVRSSSEIDIKYDIEYDNDTMDQWIGDSWD
uniref:Uncharacterized protein n=1 Tax=Rhodosorus marinus TaxID=101924 RepID=A0A7S2ZEB9_9RHOD|mmetsp:Transcript_16586/g.68050  ORF Transcript_16586/g.68050 Transcript_16586/m.68050 type:complete len:114 (+) Transcript_16586:209-550(+)